MDSERDALEEYARGEIARLETERQQAIKDKGGLPFLQKFSVGETIVQLRPKIPTNGKYGKNFVARTSEAGEDYAWSINPNSPLYKDILGYLPKAPIWLRVIRTGEGKQDTRYTVKAK